MAGEACVSSAEKALAEIYSDHVGEESESSTPTARIQQHLQQAVVRGSGGGGPSATDRRMSELTKRGHELIENLDHPITGAEIYFNVRAKLQGGALSTYTRGAQQGLKPLGAFGRGASSVVDFLDKTKAMPILGTLSSGLEGYYNPEKGQSRLGGMTWGLAKGGAAWYAGAKFTQFMGAGEEATAAQARVCVRAINRLVLARDSTR